MSEEIVSGSQTETTPEEKEDTTLQDTLSAFGIEPETKEETKEEVITGEGEPPAIETKPEPKMIKVKHNKEEIEVDVSDDKLPEYVQKSLALDKERERKTQYEQYLDRAAKLAGYKNHEEFIANLEQIEQNSQQQKTNEFQQLRTQLVTEYEDAGGDPKNLEAWLDNNPLLSKAKDVIEREQQRDEQSKVDTATQEWTGKWETLYQTYPELRESANVFAEGGAPDWYTPEMQSRIDRGYDPIDAYELAHKSTITERTKKAEQQKIIKDVQLGRRAQVETHTPADNEPSVPEELASAFAAFGLPVDSAKKYIKK